MPRPLADDIRTAILADIRAGQLSRNAIARKHGVGAATVTKLAKMTGDATAFDRSQTVQATRAREADTADARAALAARRTAFAVHLQDVAEREAAKLTAPTLYWEWGGKDHTYAQKIADEPTAADRRTIMATIATAVDRSLKLVPPQDDGAAESRSAIGDLLAGLTANYLARHGALPADPDEPE